MITLSTSLCVRRVVDRTGPISPLMHLFVREMCILKFNPDQIAAFVRELLGSGDGSSGRGGSTSVLQSVVASMLKANHAALSKALDDLVLEQKQHNLWSEITAWVNATYPSLAVELLAALRKKVPAVKDLDDAKVWAKNWYETNPRAPRPPDGLAS